MSLKTLIIYKNKALFNILIELYSDKFNIIFSDKKDIDSKILDKNNDYLLISSKNISNFKNELFISNFPLTIKKILQLINTSFLKKNFQIQSEIKIGSYFLDFNSKEISNGSKKLFLTEREANLILFLSKSKLPVNVDKLQEKVWSYNSELETHTVETHIYRLRKKIKQKFKDENFIVSTRNGYKIN